MDGLFEAMNPQDNRAFEKASVKNGIAIAMITDIKDPKNLNRVKCEYLTADNKSSGGAAGGTTKKTGGTGWIFCVTPFGGKEYGSFFHPNVGDIVVIAYENGDIHRPFVIGCLWVGESKAPLTVQDGKNEEYKFITPNKGYVDIVDTKDKQKITIATSKGRQLVFDDDKQEISITDGKSGIKISEKNGTTEITCDKKLTIKVGQGATIEIDGTSGAISIKGNKEVKIEAAQVAVKASGTGEVSANGSLEIKSSGMLTVKGSMTKIN